MTLQSDIKSLTSQIEKLNLTIVRQQDELNVLRNKAEFFDALNDNTSDLIHSVTPEGRFVFVNKAWQDTLGYSDEELKTLTLMDIVDSDCKGTCRVIFQDLISGKKIDRNETTFISKSGEKIPVQGRCSTRFVDGKAVAMTGVFRDRSDQELQAKALHESEEKYKDLFENTTDLIQLVAPNGNLLYVNRAWRETFGYHEDEIESLSIFQMISPDCQGHCQETFQKVIAEPKIHYIDTVFEAKDGRKIIIEGNAICKFVDGKPLRTQCIFRDVTQKKKMEEELNKAQKLESLGVLAGGIAHDFNNLLTAILGNVSLAKRHIYSPENIEAYLEKTERVIQRTRGLTQQLLTFSKGGSPIKKTTSIPELLKESSSFTLRGSNVSCRYDIVKDLWPAKVDEGQLNQVTQNLVINACQAMTGGGTLIIRATNVTLESGSAATLLPGNYIKLEFEDHGCGIEPANLSKIFDPYFTNKEGGNGLGLAISYSIIKNHDGEIQVSSVVGKGTIFTIYLPALSTQDIENIAPETEEFYSDIKGRILIMDDEKLVRDMSEEVLNYLGCDTVTATDGEQAIALYLEAQKNNNPFDLLIMDLTIPGGMGGVETIKKLKSINPNVKALVSSGYANDPVMANYRDYGFSGVVPKPFMVEELHYVLQQLLSSDRQ